MELHELIQMVGADAALRRRQRLQPAGGPGDKIFPPTYPSEVKNGPPEHIYERRRVAGSDEPVWCVLVDSVQSQANRLEECLRDVIADGVAIPHVVVDFSGSELVGVKAVTSFDAPHRVYDAILRDSLHDGRPFLSKDSAVGRRLLEASMSDASALLEVSPNALLFGAWNSTGQGGGLGARFARCLTSEIVAVGVPVEGVDWHRSDTEESRGRRSIAVVRTAARRPGSRVDPLGISKKVPIYQSAVDATAWTPRESDAATDKGKPVLFPAGPGKKPGRAALINHGNIPPNVVPLGITCGHLEHTVVLGFAALRRLRFGGSMEKDAAGRAYVAALGLLAMAEQDARGYALRSRCDLVCEGKAGLEVVCQDGTTCPVTLDRQGARALYEKAAAAAGSAGFTLASEPLRLTPQPKLVQIVRASQELALRGAGEGADDDAADA